MLLEGQQESHELADLAQGEKNSQLIASSDCLLAMADLRSGSLIRARDEAQAARTYFSAKQQFESEWRSLACIAEATNALGDRTSAAQYARNALDALENWQRSWELPSRQTYRTRPDIRMAVTRLRLLATPA
jgi:hypothetical protein